MNKLIIALVLLHVALLAACSSSIAETPLAILQATADTNVKTTLVALPNGYTHGVLRPVQDAPLQITPSVVPSVAPAGTATASTATPVAADSAATGQQLFVSKGCIGCHRAEANVTGPPLQNVYGAAVRLQSGATVLADDAYVRSSILNPAAQVVAAYPAVMPSYQGHVTETELAALVAYVQSLGTQP